MGRDRGAIVWRSPDFILRAIGAAAGSCRPRANAPHSTCSSGSQRGVNELLRGGSTIPCPAALPSGSRPKDWTSGRTWRSRPRASAHADRSWRHAQGYGVRADQGCRRRLVALRNLPDSATQPTLAARMRQTNASSPQSSREVTSSRRNRSCTASAPSRRPFQASKTEGDSGSSPRISRQPDRRTSTASPSFATLAESPSPAARPTMNAPNASALPPHRCRGAPPSPCRAARRRAGR